MSIYAYLGLAVVAVVIVVSFVRAIVYAPVACVKCQRDDDDYALIPNGGICPRCGHKSDEPKKQKE